MSTYDFEIGLDLHKEFSMLALLDKQGQCLRFDRLDNNILLLDKYFSQLKSEGRASGNRTFAPLMRSQKIIGTSPK